MVRIRFGRQNVLKFLAAMLILGLSADFALSSSNSCEDNLSGAPVAPVSPYIDEPVPEFQTVRRFYQGGRINKDIKIRILLLHGLGASTSSATAVEPFMKYFSNNSGNHKSGSVTKKIQNYENFVRAGAEAIDLPGHRFGAPVELFPTLDGTADYIADYIRTMKTETPELPLVVITRSAGGIFAENIVRRYPGLIDGLILTSPTCPNANTYRDALAVLREEEAQGLIKINWTGLNWAFQLMEQAHFHDETFGKVPTLIMTGGQDLETSEKERAYYTNLMTTVPGVQYINVPEAGHDLGREGGPYREKNLIATLKLMQDHLRKVAESRK